MKIALNLAVSPKLRERYAFAAATPTALVALAVLVVLVRVALADYRDYQRLRRVNADPEHREERLRRREAELRSHLDRPEFRSTLREAQFVNQLIDHRRFSISEVTLKVAKLLPLDCRLSGLGATRPAGSLLVRLQIAGKSAEALENFVSNLENSPEFTEVTVASEGFEQSQGAQPGEVHVTCTARYLENKQQ